VTGKTRLQVLKGRLAVDRYTNHHVRVIKRNHVPIMNEGLKLSISAINSQTPEMVF